MNNKVLLIGYAKHNSMPAYKNSGGKAPWVPHIGIRETRE
jgi:hypothetical protein